MNSCPLLLALVLASGCTSAPTSDASAPRTLVSDDAAQEASYSVPVAAELEPYATYPVAGVGFDRIGTHVTITYALPATLVGTAEVVQFDGELAVGETTFTVSSATYGDSTCTVDAERVHCAERLRGISVDHAAVQAQLLAAKLSSAEVAARTQISQQFSIDPIGVLDFAIP